MLNVKEQRKTGCTFFGKGIVGRPELGVIVGATEVVFDTWNPFEEQWEGDETVKNVYLTDNGFVLSEDDLGEIELYAPNWRVETFNPIHF